GAVRFDDERLVFDMGDIEESLARQDGNAPLCFVKPDPKGRVAAEMGDASVCERDCRDLSNRRRIVCGRMNPGGWSGGQQQKTECQPACCSSQPARPHEAAPRRSRWMTFR